MFVLHADALKRDRPVGRATLHLAAALRHRAPGRHSKIILFSMVIVQSWY
jgi:hypothetical protein